MKRTISAILATTLLAGAAGAVTYNDDGSYVSERERALGVVATETVGDTFKVDADRALSPQDRALIGLSQVDVTRFPAEQSADTSVKPAANRYR